MNATHSGTAVSASEKLWMVSASSATEPLKNTTTGPGAEGRNAIVSFLAAAPGINRLVPDFAVESVKNFDEAKKYLEQYAQGAASSMGPGSDAKLASALSANASTKISNLAAQDVEVVVVEVPVAEEVIARWSGVCGTSPAKVPTHPRWKNQF